jgi:two-component system, OmpR family, response regulator AdeR
MSTLHSMPIVLVVEDETEIADVLEAYLRKDGFRTERAADGERALELARIIKPDLILLDIMLPKKDGLEVLRKVRADGNTPVILLTARAEDIDKLVGLELGADDYVVKPFSPREVVARVKAVLRRARPEEKLDVLRVGALELDVRAVAVKASGSRLDLTLTEFRLLEALMRAVGRAFTRAELLEVALPDSDALERVVDAHLKNLRHKLADVGVGDMLETVRGIGYRLRFET